MPLRQRRPSPGLAPCLDARLSLKNGSPSAAGLPTAPVPPLVVPGLPVGSAFVLLPDVFQPRTGDLLPIQPPVSSIATITAYRCLVLEPPSRLARHPERALPLLF